MEAILQQRQNRPHPLDEGGIADEALEVDDEILRFRIESEAAQLFDAISATDRCNLFEGR